MIIPIIFFALLLYALSSIRNTYITFWISLAFYFDPGGFFSNAFGSVFFGHLKYYDAFFLLMTICFLSANDIHLKELNFDKLFLRFVKYFVFLEIYYVTIYGWLTPYLNGINSDNNFSLFILKERTTVYGLFIVIYVYLFAKRGLLYHYKLIVFTGVFCLVLFIIGYLSGRSFVPTTVGDRYSGEELERVGMLSYGLFQVILSMALIIYFFSSKFKVSFPLKKLVFIGGALMFLASMLTLTRRTLIEIAILPFIILWVRARITNTTIKYGKIIAVFILGIILLGVLAPRYINWVGRMYKDIGSLVTTGKDTRGETEYRLSRTGNMIYVKENIKKRPFLGTGFLWILYSDSNERILAGDTYAAAWWAAREVPVYYAFFSRGILGFVLYIPVYIFILKALIVLYKLLKERFNEFIVRFPILCIMGLVVFIEFLLLFSISAYTLFGSFSNPNFMFYCGLLFSIKFSLGKISYEIQMEKNPVTILN
jgi:O-Antigen ligase